jgi:hypothetical protein
MNIPQIIGAAIGTPHILGGIGGLVLIALFAAYTFWDYRRHKRPLLEIDPNVAYGYFHHLHVVTFPMWRYRITSQVAKLLPTKKI